jgi:hypothetical protein
MLKNKNGTTYKISQSLKHKYVQKTTYLFLLWRLKSQKSKIQSKPLKFQRFLNLGLAYRCLSQNARCISANHKWWTKVSRLLAWRIFLNLNSKY